MNSEERAWLAGLLEGEGCFTFVRHKANVPSPRIALAMNDEDVVRRAQAVTGLGNVRERPTYKRGKGSQWWWDVSTAHEAGAIMLWLYPYLGQRRQQRIREVMEPWVNNPRVDGNRYRDRTHCKRGHEFTEENTIRTPNGRECRACRQVHNENTKDRRRGNPEYLELRRMQYRVRKEAQRAA